MPVPMPGARLPTVQPLERAFDRHRRYLFGLCYRMAGCGADAEDLVQDTFERALRNPPADLERELRPWLTRVAMNACRDHLRRRRARGYPGTWLPGPVEASLEDPLHDGVDPEARYGMLESVSFAFLLALEALTPGQRAVLLLRDVFDLSVRETAETLEMSEGNVKTTLHRARAAMASYDGQRRPITLEHQAAARRALEALLMHVVSGNTSAVRELLAEDVVSMNDAGGKMIAARKVVIGRDKVMTFLRKTTRTGMFDLSWRVLNGTAALMIDSPYPKPNYPETVVFWVELDGVGRIREFNLMAAPRKISRLPWDSLERPSAGEVLGALRSALTQPPPAQWALPAARDFLARRLGFS